MSETLIARRYAEGLNAIFEDDASLQPALDALLDFVDLYRSHDALRMVLENPAIDVAQRARVLDGVLSRMQMPAEPASFLRALFKRHRIRLVTAAVEEFSRICDERLNRESAEITTALPLPESQVGAVVHAVGTFAGKSIHPTMRVDPSIIGGIVVRVGGFVLDRSVRHELDRIENELLERE